MPWRSVVYIPVFSMVLALCAALPAAASTYRGVVTFGGLPLPGATISATQKATQGTKTAAAVSDQQGLYQFDDLADGDWTIEVEMQCFATIHAAVRIAPNMAAASWEMKLLPQEKILAQAQQVKPAVEVPPAPSTAPAKNPEQQPAQSNSPEMPKEPQQENEQSADGFPGAGQREQRGDLAVRHHSAFGNTRSGSKACTPADLSERREFGAGCAAVFAERRRAAKAGLQRFHRSGHAPGSNQDSPLAAARAELFRLVPVDAQQQLGDQHRDWCPRKPSRPGTWPAW
jgi:type IV secretory pathway VirB10-like protein